MPCPPFTNSNCTSAGRPNYLLEEKERNSWLVHCRDSEESVRIDLVRFGFFLAFIELDFYENSMFFRKARKFRCFFEKQGNFDVFFEKQENSMFFKKQGNSDVFRISKNHKIQLSQKNLITKNT
jgi:hypothetical protein